MGNAFKNLKVLITGGVGFIGSNLAHRLVAEGAKVTLADAMLAQFHATLFSIDAIRSQIELNFCDVSHGPSMAQLVRDQDLIFCLAGQMSHSESMKHPIDDLALNCQGTLSTLEAVRHHAPQAQLVFASTRQIYGRPQSLPVTEEHPIRPVDINGIHKYAAEEYMRLYAEVYGLKTVSLRLTNTYGPRMDLKSLTKGLTGIFVRQALGGDPIRLYGGGTQLRDFNYIDDVVEAMLLAARLDQPQGQAYNLAFPKPYRLEELAGILTHLTGVPVEKVDFPASLKAIDIGDYYGDSSAFNQTTGWQPKVGLEDGLKQTISFYREYGRHYLPR